MDVEKMSAPGDRCLWRVSVRGESGRQEAVITSEARFATRGEAGFDYCAPLDVLLWPGAEFTADVCAEAMRAVQRVRENHAAMGVRPEALSIKIEYADLAPQAGRPDEPTGRFCIRVKRQF